MWILAIIFGITIAVCIGIIIYQENRIKDIKKSKDDQCKLDNQHLESYAVRVQALTDERDYLKINLKPHYKIIKMRKKR